mmetsp:Transcript_20098/g.47023  ORF Transcript_20098/g.47023 Transcript_20098/m.47023 type:complete len:93 (-) Transcript_20098:89-367(-)
MQSPIQQCAVVLFVDTVSKKICAIGENRFLIPHVKKFATNSSSSTMVLQDDDDDDAMNDSDIQVWIPHLQRSGQTKKQTNEETNKQTNHLQQ